jgi:SAM-dependent methyltransferase
MVEANEAQRAQWNGDGGQHWVASADERDRILQPVADVLLTAAGLQAGEDVLDIGCGCGVTTLAAIDQVAPGTVTGADLSSVMLAVARERAAGRPGVTFLEADLQTDPFEPRFDVLLSRFGTMFFDDPIAAFTNLHRAARPGGRLCIATWQPLTANDWLMIPGTVLLERGSLPALVDPGPGMFAQSDPDEVRSVLAAGGWQDIVVDPVHVELVLGADAEGAAAYLGETGIARRVLETIPPEEQAAAMAAVTEVLARHDHDGVRLGAGIHVVTARAQ